MWPHWPPVQKLEISSPREGHTRVTVLAIFAALLAGCGLVQAVAGYFAVRRFVAAPLLPQPPSRPPITLLKPLHGDEPLLEAALASICAQEYGVYQIVFGVQSPTDTALPVLERLRQRFPHCDITVVVDPTPHGSNLKVANLINMFPSAKHDVLVIADSDVHCAPNYLERIGATLAIPGTGMATMLYAGIAASRSLAGLLGSSWINHTVVPGVLMARGLGRQDCLGATMALRRETLSAIGGLPALMNHLADDNILGKLIESQGLAVRIPDSVTVTTVPETGVAELFRHELRWARTILAMAPIGYAMSVIQFVLFWAALAVALSGGSAWSLKLFLIAWVVRAATAIGIDRSLGLVKSGLATAAPIWLFPLRDLISMTIMLASYGGDQVEWRGQMMSAGRIAPRRYP
jgi:ceramide glucosyltransferase